MRRTSRRPPWASGHPPEEKAVGLFKKDKGEKKPKNDGSDKTWGQIFRDMPKTPTTRDMAQGTANAASFMKNMAAQGDQGRLRSTGLKGTAVIHQFRDTGSRVGLNPVMELQLLVHVDGRPDYPVTHEQQMAPIVVNGLSNGKQLVCHVNPEDPTEMIIDF
jgi:hypothetical protein